MYRHEIAVYVCHAAVAQAEPPIMTVGELSRFSKFMPNRVSEVIDDSGEFGVWSELVTGESKLKESRKVPTVNEIVTPVVLAVPEPTAPWQSNVVAATQDELRHGVTPIRTDVEVSVPPKFRPVTEMVPSDVVGKFSAMRSVISAASYVNTFITVPIKLPMMIVLCSPEPVLVGDVHVTSVLEVHTDVEHVSVPTCPDGVESLRPKFTPWNVTAAPVVVGPFTAASPVSVGASKLNTAL